jgi:hypothetical protein
MSKQLGHDGLSKAVRKPLTGELPVDPLNRRDLQEVLSSFESGAPISWVCVFRLAKPGPTAHSQLAGPDWHLEFGPEPFSVPWFDEDGHVSDLQLAPPIALLAATTSEPTVSAARTIGRPRLRSLIGYVNLVAPLLTGAELAWEGAMAHSEDGGLRLATGQTQVAMRFRDEAIAAIRQGLAPLSLGQLDARHLLALEWFAEARLTTSPTSRLVDLWCAVVAVVDSTYARADKRKLDQIARIDAYLGRLQISSRRREQLSGAFHSAYELRNRLVHEGDRACVTDAAVESLHAAVKEFLWTDLGRS